MAFVSATATQLGSPPTGKNMIKTAGVLLGLAFLAASLAGTVGSGWILGEAVHPARAGSITGSLTLGMLLAGLALVIELVRLAVSLCGERIWRGSRFQGAAFALPLWLACTSYCILMPLLALALVPLLPAGSHMLTVIAPAWAALQIVAGLLPGMQWSSSEPTQQSLNVVQKPAQKALPAALPVSEPAQAEAANATTAQLATESAASAEDFFRFLSKLSDLPAGSTLPRRGRIGTNREILISQAGLAALVGRSKPTVRRWLQELERGARIVKRPRGKDTCILLSKHAGHLNGEAHVNGAESRAA